MRLNPGSCIKMPFSRGKKLPKRFKKPKNSKKSPVIGQPAINTRNKPNAKVTVARNLDGFVKYAIVLDGPMISGKPDTNIMFPSFNSIPLKNRVTPMRVTMQPLPHSMKPSFRF